MLQKELLNMEEVKDQRGRKNKCKNCGVIFIDENYKKRNFCNLICYRKSEQFKKMIIENGLKCRGRKIIWKEKIGKANEGRYRPDMIGESNWNWKGGLNKENRRWIMSLSPYKLWRKAIFKRDNWTCKICKDKNGDGKTIKLIAHHLEHWIDNKKLRYSIKNGMTVCKECHILGHQLLG